MSIDGSQKDTGVSVAEEGELSSQTGTHSNVVLGSVRAKPELHNRKHVLFRKHRDLLWFKYGRDLQFREAFASQFDQMPTHR